MPLLLTLVFTRRGRKPPRAKQRITPRALLEIKRLSDPQLHPDGQRVAFVVTEADFDESEWVSHLWLTEYLLPEEDLEEETERQGDREAEEKEKKTMTAAGEENTGEAEEEPRTRRVS